MQLARLCSETTVAVASRLSKPFSYPWAHPLLIGEGAYSTAQRPNYELELSLHRASLPGTQAGRLSGWGPGSWTFTHWVPASKNVRAAMAPKPRSLWARGVSLLSHNALLVFNTIPTHKILAEMIFQKLQFINTKI